MIQDRKIKIYRKALRYMNHEATSFYMKQQVDITNLMFSNNPGLSNKGQLEEKVGNIIKTKFPLNEQEKIIDLIESVTNFNITMAMERKRLRELKKRVILFPFLLLERTMIKQFQFLVYETNTTFAMLRQDGVPTNWGKLGLQDDIRKGDAVVVIAPDVTYKFIEKLPDIVYSRQLSTIKVIAELTAFKNSWVNNE